MKTVKIKQDSFLSSPRESMDNLGTIVYKHSRYILGDESISDPNVWLSSKLDINIFKYGTQQEILEYLIGKFEEKYIVLPVYLYDHSGITISTTPFSCRWDSGQVGYIYVSKEDVCKEYSVKRISPKIRETVLRVLNAEIEMLDYHLRGDVYGYEIVDENGEVEDSCWGFYGTDWDDNGLKSNIPEELQSQLDSIEIIYE